MTGQRWREKLHGLKYSVGEEETFPALLDSSGWSDNRHEADYQEKMTKCNCIHTYGTPHTWESQDPTYVKGSETERRDEVSVTF